MIIVTPPAVPYLQRDRLCEWVLAIHEARKIPLGFFGVFAYWTPETVVFTVDGNVGLQFRFGI